MGERSLKSWWRRRLPDLSAAASRFPVAVLIAGLLTFYRLNHDLARDVDARIIGALAASFLWAVSVDFYVESGARSLATRVVLWIAGIFGIALLFYFFWDIWLSPYLLFGALLILVGLSGHLSLKGIKRDLLAVQSPALARRASRAGWCRPVRSRTGGDHRDDQVALRPFPAGACSRAHHQHQPLLRRTGELPRVRTAEL